MSSYIIAALILCVANSGIFGPIYLNSTPNDNIIYEEGALKGTVSSSKELPEEFYGTWSVSGIVVSTNDPEIFNVKTSDIWSFEKINDVITLTNPNTGASASITIDEVQNKTATFTREKANEKQRQKEKATITVEGNEFSGKDIITYEYLNKGKIVSTTVVEYDVKGRKLSGPRMEDIFSK